MLRDARQNKILELIEEKEIDTQEELCKELAKSHFNVTQATVSRDVRELRLFKIAGKTKRFRYAASNKTDDSLPDKMQTLFRACVESIQLVGNIIVTKTLYGNGSNAGAIIDKLEYPEIVGSIAGDDTVFSICRTPEEAIAAKERLFALSRG